MEQNTIQLRQKVDRMQAEREIMDRENEEARKRMTQEFTGGLFEFYVLFSPCLSSGSIRNNRNAHVNAHLR